MRFILVLLLLFLAGCATRQVPYGPSVYLLSTNKEPRWLLDEVSEELVKNKYEVESLDYNLGLLVMSPRKFVILRGEQRSYGEQKIQMRQEGGSVKLQMSYACSYAQGESSCLQSDGEAIDKIRRIERLIMAMVNRMLFKKPGEERIKSKEI